jgi:putative selenate reductase FAD-binding subunit
MTPLEYLLPETLEQALEYLDQGIPLAGGTVITPRRSDVRAVVDLRHLGLDGIQIQGASVEIGATTRLQSIIEAEENLPKMLREACKLEAGWNLRNMATIGGAIMSLDGRSPLLTTLLALNTQIIQQPGPVILPLNDVLEERSGVKLITGIQFDRPTALLYEQVARAPADFPLVCAAMAYWKDVDERKIGIAIGGYGTRPLQLDQIVGDQGEKKDFQSVFELAQAAYGNAGDAWASAEYRSEVAGVLVRRLLGEVVD